MGKPVLRVVLSAAAVIFTLNFLQFSYGRHVVLPLLGALLLLAVLIGLGEWLAGLFRIPGAGMMEKAALGLMAATAYFYILCFLQILNHWTLLLFFAFSLALFILRFFVHEGRQRSREEVRRFFSRPLSEYGIFLLPLAYASLPPTFYDSLVYHLGIPNLLLQSGGFVAAPQFVYANTFIYYEISLVPAVFLGDLVPRLFHFFLGALFVLAVADVAVEHWGIKKKATLILALVSLPMTLFLLATCKNDLAGAIFIFLAIARFQRGDWKLSAVFWGFAVGIKYFNLLPLAVFLLVLFRPWKAADLRKAALVVLIVFLVASPLLLKNFLLAGNPFSPFLADAFPSAYWNGARYAYLQADVGRMYGSLREFLKFPYELSFSERGSGGIVGPLFIIFLPFLLLAPVFRKKWLVFSLLVLSATPFLSGSFRFAYIAVVLLTVYCVYALESSATRLLKWVFVSVLAVNLFLGAALLERVYASHLLWSGKISPEEYKADRFPTYPLFAYINANVPPGAKILLAGEARNFYLGRPYQVSSALDYGILKKYLPGARDAAGFIAAIHKDGYSYLAVNFFELQRLQKAYMNYTPEEEGKLLGFFRALAPVFHQGPLFLYETG
jgi:hypothetical protein